MHYLNCLGIRIVYCNDCLIHIRNINVECVDGITLKKSKRIFVKLSN